MTAAATEQEFLALEDGDAVALAVKLTPKAWTDYKGTAHPILGLN